MAKENDGMRGAWHFTGQCWFCDCPSDGLLLCVHVGQGGHLSPGRAHSPGVNKCNRCGVYRPLARDRPELGNALPHGIKRVVREETVE